MSDEASKFAAKAMSSMCHGLHTLCVEKVLCDLQVTVGGQTFHCHLLLLASVSEFFRSLASSSWRENHTGEVKIDHDDVTTESFQMLLDILYKMEDVVTIDTATDVLRMAIFLQVKFLEQHCIDFLIHNITPEVCVGIWMFAEKYQLPELANTASAMASDEISLVVESGEIFNLPRSMLLVVLGAQRKLSMNDTCRTILRWVEEDTDARQVYFEELLPFVSFPQLSPEYIYELMKYFDHPFFKHINHQIRQAVSFNLQNQTPEIKRQILGQQETVTDSPLVQKCAVVLGGCGTDDTQPQHVTAFAVEPGKKFYSFTLQDFPESFDGRLATCSHRNELFVSRGKEKKTFVTRYMPGSNEWEMLPHLELELEKHSMSAVSDRLYLIGGSSKNDKIQHGISCYDISTKTWTLEASQLQVSVEDAATAVVGHRIYVFGGKDGLQEPVSVVQCVDTRSRRVYRAGCLPSLADTIMALSDGGTIYLLCDGTRVLKMKEFFELADRKESALKGEPKASRGDEQQPLVASENSTPAPSVSFAELGSFGDKKVMSAYLHNGEMVGCGAMSSEGDATSDVWAMNLTTGEVTIKRLAFQKPLSSMMLRTLNIPREFLMKKKQFCAFEMGTTLSGNQVCRFQHGSTILADVI